VPVAAHPAPVPGTPAAPKDNRQRIEDPPFMEVFPAPGRQRLLG